MAEPNLWLVTKWQDGGALYEIMGIYNSEDVAVETCVTNKHVVMPMTLNERLPEDVVEEHGYFPHGAY